jgi:hypothetical protein
MWFVEIYLTTFLGEISPNLNLKDMIGTYTKDFSWKM